MIKSELVKPHHLQRRAVVYVRQSTSHQVLSNLESQKMQHAMREHAKLLGWDENQIDVVELDTGNSAKSTAGRDGYKNLLSEIALGRVGAVISYESARLSRNCSDWYPLLDLCSYQQCVIVDRDGVYDPSTANGRLLLGMKGILSELELHTLKGRLLAGVQNKARRGELVVALPAGLTRLEDGRVVKDPNIQVQEAIELVFNSLLDLKSVGKVLRHFTEHELRIPKRHRNREVQWRPATAARILAILHNPAYAGAFAYGRRRVVHKPDGSGPHYKSLAMKDWKVLLKDRYPAYVSWETFERIQSILSDNYATYQKMSRGISRQGAALLQGLVYCGCCGHKMGTTYKDGPHYRCDYDRYRKKLPTCQYVAAQPVDKCVVGCFFEALTPAELDVYNQAMKARNNQWSEIQAAQERELQRLRYEVDLARRQYERVDPDNRLVAGELERRWESALRELRDTEERFAKARSERDKVVPLHIPHELQKAFQSLGQSLPSLWQQDNLSDSQRKEFLRCLINKVVLRREQKQENVLVRIVWRGGAVSERDVSVPVASNRNLSRFEEMEAKILELEAEGKSDQEIAQLLTQQGFHSAHSDKVPVSTVQNVRYKHRRIHRYRGPKPRKVAGYLTVSQVAKRLGVKSQWLYYLIRRGKIDIELDGQKKMYLFPDRPEVLEDLQRLRDGKLDRVVT